jgi:FKBP-type peptidyl-prolyl cis-trans isomerase
MMIDFTIPVFALLHTLTTLAVVRGFTAVPFSLQAVAPTNPSFARHLARRAHQGDDWISLAENGSVQKRILEPGTGTVPQEGSEVEVEYVGTLVGEKAWSSDDVVECWLKNQQGLDHLADAFVAAEIDGSKLMDASFFTEDFLMNDLGLSNKIQCKKLVMASKRLAKQQDDFPAGTEFDSSADRGPFKFSLGAGSKAIRAYDLAVATMLEGERAEIICRADYAYGAEGYRKRNGDVVVPPFATLRFDIKLQKCYKL